MMATPLRHLCRASVIAGVLIGIETSQAAQGRIGATSTATARISLIIPQRAEVSTGHSDPSGSASSESDFAYCLSRDDASSYAIRARGDAGGNRFEMRNREGDRISYTVTLKQAGAATAVLFPGDDSPSITVGSEGCTTGNAPDIGISVLEAHKERAEGDAYAGALYLVLVPD